jgi:hypothetical protein
MISIKDYVKIYNKCCLVYLGNSSDVIKEIILKIKEYQLEFPDIKIYLCCKDELFNNSSDVLIKKSELANLKNNFCYIKEIKGMNI